MKTMILKSISVKTIQGIELIEAYWESKTGRVSATSRLMGTDQFAIGSVFKGIYANKGVRHFTPQWEVK